MKKLLVFLIALVVLGFAGWFYAARVTDWNGYKPALLSAVEERTGVRMEIDGPLELRVFPTPRFTARFVRVPNDEAGAAAAFGDTVENVLTVRQIDAELDLQELLSRRFAVTLVLVDPDVNIERYRGGGYNVERFIELMHLGANGRDPWGNPVGSGGAPPQSGRFAIQALRLEGGRFRFRDFQDGSLRELIVQKGGFLINVPNGSMTAEGEAVYSGSLYRYSFFMDGTPERKKYLLDGQIARLASGTQRSLTFAFAGNLDIESVKLNVKASSRETYIPFSGPGSLEEWLRRTEQAESEVADGFWAEAELEGSRDEGGRLRLAVTLARRGPRQDQGEPTARHRPPRPLPRRRGAARRLASLGDRA